jgi:hypothetical protein
MTAIFSPAAARWMSAHHHVATTAELRRLGLGLKATARLCRLGVLARVGRGVFVGCAGANTLEHRCRILCSFYPGGFVTGTTGAMLEGLRRQPVSSALQFSVRHGVHLEPRSGVTFRQTTKLRSDDRRLRDDGIAVASWPRLAFDLAADLRAIDHRSVIHQLLDRRLVGADELLAIGQRLCHPARRGSTTFRASLLELGASQDSHPEVLVLDALVRRGVPAEAQVAVPREDGLTFHIDIAVPEVRWGVELDIHPEHRSVDGHHRDARRVRSLHIAAWQIEPVSEFDLHDLEGLADNLAELYHDRARSIGVSDSRNRVVRHSGGFQHSGD